MENYDYVVLIDENGQPYIAHSFKSRVSSGWGKVKGAGKRAYGAARTAGSKAHKYLLKVGQGVKAKYAYSPEEVDALLGRGKRAVKNAGEKISSGAKKAGAAVKRAGIKAADKLGVDDRIRANKTNEMFQNNKNTQTFIAKQDAKEAYEATPLGKAEGFLKRAGDIAKRYGSMTLGAIKTAPGRVKEAADKAADKLGVDERYRLKNAEDLVRSFKEGIDKGEKPTASTLKGAYDYLATARKDYADTPLGKAEGAARKAGAAAKAAANKIDETIDTARQNAADRREASRKAKYAASRMGDSEAGQTRADSRTTKAVMNYNNALKEYNKVQNTGGEDEASAYWALVAAEREYERITGQKPPKRGK